MLPLWRQRVVDGTGQRRFNDRVLGNIPVLRAVECLLNVGAIRTDMNRSSMLRSRLLSWQTSEIGYLREREVDLATATRVIETFHCLHELARKVLLVHEPKKCHVRVNARHDFVGVILIAAC